MRADLLSRRFWLILTSWPFRWHTNSFLLPLFLYPRNLLLLRRSTSLWHVIETTMTNLPLNIVRCRRFPLCQYQETEPFSPSFIELASLKENFPTDKQCAIDSIPDPIVLDLLPTWSELP
jgi:hypothetical protein